MDSILVSKDSLDQSKTNGQLLAEVAELRRQLAYYKDAEKRRQLAEERLYASEERFQQVALSVSDHIYITEMTAEGDFVNLYLSPHSETLTGYPREACLTDWHFWSSTIIHPEDRAIAAAQVTQLAKGQDAECEYRLIRADGAVVWVRDYARIQRRAGTRLIYGVVSNISERKNLEARLMAIYQLGQELYLLHDEHTILKRGLETVAKILTIGSARCDLIDETTGQIKRRYQLVANSTLEGAAAGKRFEMITTVNDSTHPGPYLPSGEAGLRSHLSVPLKIGERLIGLLRIEGIEAGDFKAGDRQLLQILADQTAVSIENTRLYNETRQRVEELAAMTMIGQAIISTLDLPETLTIITDHAIRLLNVSTASVALYDKKRGDLWLDAVSGEGADILRGKRLPLHRGIVGWVVQQGEAALVPDVAQDDRFFEAIDRMTGLTTRSVLCVPLQTHAQTIGAIELRNKKGRPFDQKDLRLLGWLAMPAATAIENARLFEAQRAAREQAETLREATSTLTSTLNLNHLLDNILIHLEHVLPYDSACVFLREREWLYVVAGRGSAPDQLVQRRQRPVDDSLYQEIQATGRPLVLINAKEDPRFQGWDETDNVKGWMGVPLMVRSEVIGYLTLDSHRVGAYGNTEADLAQAFANQAAVAIHNARLFEEVRLGHKRLQSLSRRLVQGQETERRHIARELHDEAGQALTTLRVGLHLLEQDAHDAEAVVTRTGKLKRLTETVLDNLHRLAMDLRPASLDHLGLVAALDQFIEAFNDQYNLMVQFETVGLNEQRLSATMEINLYRIVQEALTNIGRHAKATRADVLIKRRGERIIVVIEDDGLGFDPKVVNRKSRLGLLGMRERAEMLGGSLTVESRLNAGTTVYVEVPYVPTYSHR